MKLNPHNAKALKRCNSIEGKLKILSTLIAQRRRRRPPIKSLIGILTSATSATSIRSLDESGHGSRRWPMTFLQEFHLVCEAAKQADFARELTPQELKKLQAKLYQFSDRVAEARLKQFVQAKLAESAVKK
jgi:hypothetical protein